MSILLALILIFAPHRDGLSVILGLWLLFDVFQPLWKVPAGSGSSRSARWGRVWFIQRHPILHIRQLTSQIADVWSTGTELKGQVKTIKAETAALRAETEVIVAETEALRATNIENERRILVMRALNDAYTMGTPNDLAVLAVAEVLDEPLEFCFSVADDLLSTLDKGTPPTDVA